MAEADRKLQAKARKIYDLLLAEYGVPEWKPTRSGFEQLIHTILSANTNDNNSDRAFETLKQRFAGDWDAVRTAPLEEIKNAIRVAGMYNQKAPHIVETLEILHREQGLYSLEHVPDMAPAAAQSYLLRFPGVGHKTASIVLLFSYGMAAFPSRYARSAPDAAPGHEWPTGVGAEDQSCLGADPASRNLLCPACQYDPARTHSVQSAHAALRPLRFAERM